MRARSLVLVPTELERRALLELGGIDPALGELELAGFGPIAAAARTAQLLARLRPRRVLLLGIAGTYLPERHPVGSALSCTSVALEGVGAGEGPSARSAAQLGFAHWSGAAGGPAIGERLELARASANGHDPGALLLTVCAASDSAELASARRARFPGCAAEDMEGFAVALACALEETPLAIVRGLSNVAGERDTRRWEIRSALEAVRALALEALRCEAWEARA